MNCQCFELPPLGTNAYVCWEDGHDKALLIDAPATVWEAIQATLNAKGLTLEAVLLTHGHFDHILGLPECNSAGIPVYAHPLEKDMIARSRQQMAMFGMRADAEPGTVDHWLELEQPLRLLGHDIELRWVPGHSPGSVLFHFPKAGVAFCGDAIFSGSIGRTDLPGGSFEQLETAIRKEIYTLPPETVLYPGHGPQTCVAAEREGNPFVRP